MTETGTDTPIANDKLRSRNVHDKDPGREHYGNFLANITFLDMLDPISPEAKVLEIGSGTGAMLTMLRERGMDAVGTEINDGQIAEAQAKHPGLPISKVTGARLPFDDDSFDVVASFDVIEHIPDTDEHLDEVTRVLKPGGRYILQSPNKWTNSVFETIRWKSLSKWKVDHCSLHSHGQFTRRFEKHGYSVRFIPVPVVTDYFRQKIRNYLGPIGGPLLAITRPDSWPMPMRTNFYIEAVRRD